MEIQNIILAPVIQKSRNLKSSIAIRVRDLFDLKLVGCIDLNYLINASCYDLACKIEPRIYMKIQRAPIIIGGWNAIKLLTVCISELFIIN